MKAGSPHGHIQSSVNVLHLKPFQQSQLPPRSSWLYSVKMHNVDTEESLLLPSTSWTNVKGCYEVLWVKENIPSCIQIISTCLLANSQTKFQNEDEKHLRFVHRFQRFIGFCAELHMKLGPVTLEKLVLLLSQQKKNPWKGLTCKAFHFLSVCWSSTDDFM